MPSMPNQVYIALNYALCDSLSDKIRDLVYAVGPLLIKESEVLNQVAESRDRFLTELKRDVR